MVILLSAVGGVLWLGANFECARFYRRRQAVLPELWPDGVFQIGIGSINHLTHPTWALMFW
jgi:hypothetical protein